jgi:hypothetical protein
MGGNARRDTTFNKDLDVTPFLKGLPDDMDPTEHWGYVFNGRFRVIYKAMKRSLVPGMCSTQSQDIRRFL